MSRHTDQESPTVRTSAPTHEPPPAVGSPSWKLQALTDFTEELVASATGSKREIRRDRLQEDIQVCMELDRCVIPLGLILASTATLSKQEVAALLTRLPDVLAGDPLSALDRVSETILMIDDADIRASAAIATSVLVQRSLPVEVVIRDRLLMLLMELVDVQFRERRTRHSDIFAALRHLEKAPTLGQLPGLLSEISDALEDLACERGVFLDNPMEIAPKKPVKPTSPMDILRETRVQSGASLPSLNEELGQIAAVAESLGWSEDRGVQLLTDLYRHKAMDTRSKLGLNPAAVYKVMADLHGLLETPVGDLRIEENRAVAAPYSYDMDSRTLTLNIGYRGGLTAKLLEEEHPKILEEIKQAKAAREATTLSLAIDRYHAARAAAGGEPIPEEVEKEQIEALAARMGVTTAAAYDTVAGLYGAKRVRFSTEPRTGITLQTIMETVEAAGKPGSIVRITVDPEAPGVIPFRVDRDSRTLVLHSAFEKLTDVIFKLFVQERAADPFEIVEPNEERLADYEGPKDPGSLANVKNRQQLIEELGLSPDDAQDAFDVLLEDCRPFRETITIQTLRVVVATINSRLQPDGTVDVVTGWCRDIPGTKDPDHFSVAWLTSHTEEDMSLNMLTFNFAYGEGKAKLPPLSDELLLDWCRHYRVEAYMKD